MFCVDIAHSKLVADRFTKAGYRAAHVDGDTDKNERRALIAALGTGEIQVVSNCGLISEGLDVPGVIAAILLRPTKSLALYLQQVGRALRPAPGKAKALILDHAGNTYRHGPADAPHAWSLEGRAKNRTRQRWSAAVRNAARSIRLRRCAARSVAPLREPAPPRPRVEVRSNTLIEIDRLDQCAIGKSLRWAGKSEDRLRLIARARGYKKGWVWHRLQELRVVHDMTPLEPDCNQLEIFIEGLFRHCGKDGSISLRAFYEGDGSKSFRISNISLKGGLRFLIEAAEDDARRAAQHPKPIVFCPPVAVFHPAANGRAREQDIFEAPALSVELDQNPRAALEALERLLGPATLVIRSGGFWTDPTTGEFEDKLHAHWRLKEPARGADIVKLKQARRLATAIVGGDPTNVPACHPIRWPGSWHKKAEPRLCEIIGSDHLDNELDLAAALTALEASAPKGKSEPQKGRYWQQELPRLGQSLRRYHHRQIPSIQH